MSAASVPDAIEEHPLEVIKAEDVDDARSVDRIVDSDERRRFGGMSTGTRSQNILKCFNAYNLDNWRNCRVLTLAKKHWKITLVARFAVLVISLLATVTAKVHETPLAKETNKEEEMPAAAAASVLDRRGRNGTEMLEAVRTEVAIAVQTRDDFTGKS